MDKTWLKMSLCSLGDPLDPINLSQLYHIVKGIEPIVELMTRWNSFVISSNPCHSIEKLHFRVISPPFHTKVVLMASCVI